MRTGWIIKAGSNISELVSIPIAITIDAAAVEAAVLGGTFVLESAKNVQADLDNYNYWKNRPNESSVTRVVHEQLLKQI